jgi:uncharacterized protein YoxC
MSSSKDTGSRTTLPALKILNIEDILFTTVEAICQDSLLQILNNDQSSKNYAIDRICELVSDSFSASKAEAMLLMEEKIKTLYATIHEFRKQVYDLKDQNSNYRKGIENLNQELSKSQATIRQLHQLNSESEENYHSEINREMNRLEGENHVLLEQKNGFLEQKNGFLEDIGVLVEENEKFKLVVCELTEMNSDLRNEVYGGGLERGGLVREYEEKIKK